MSATESLLPGVSACDGQHCSSQSGLVKREFCVVHAVEGIVKPSLEYIASYCPFVDRDVVALRRELTEPV